MNHLVTLYNLENKPTVKFKKIFPKYIDVMQYSVFFLVFFCLFFFYFTDISEIESYRSYSPQEDRQGHHSDLSSHSSNERLREKPR